VTFPLLADIWTANQATGQLQGVAAARLTGVPCQLRYWAGGSVGRWESAQVDANGVLAMLLFPAFTDVRTTLCAANYRPDWINCPAGSTRWYRVAAVDDNYKGTPDEHREAICQQGAPSGFAGAAMYWGIPIP